MAILGALSFGSIFLTPQAEDSPSGRAMKIQYPNGCEFDILVLRASGSPYEPDDWWRLWFQSALDGIMIIEPPPPRAYFFRLLVITGLPTQATPASFDLMGTCWN